MFRSPEILAHRAEVAEQIRAAFRPYNVGTDLQNPEAGPEAFVVGYINAGCRGQRGAVVNIDDQGNCRLYVTPLYDIPPPYSEGRRFQPPAKFLARFPQDTPDIAADIMRAISDHIKND